VRNKASRLIRTLKLNKHPEGGYFREIYRSNEKIPRLALPARYKKSRNFSTHIYFLLLKDEPSMLHRLKSDEIWHLYDGGPLTLHVISQSGRLTTVILAKNIEGKSSPCAVIPRNSWFGATIDGTADYCLLGCTVAPGFDFDDFKLADRRKMLMKYPEYRNIIETLTKKEQRVFHG